MNTHAHKRDSAGHPESTRSVRPNTPLINSNSIKILKDTGKIEQYGTPTKIRERLFRLHKEKENTLYKKQKNLNESFSEEMNKSRISKNSKELIENKGPRPDI